jgi:hypothetical protein
MAVLIFINVISHDFFGGEVQPVLKLKRSSGRPAFGGGPPLTCPSGWAGEGKWSRPQASGCHGPMPFVETHSRASLQKAGPGSIVLQHDLQSPLAQIPLFGYPVTLTNPLVQDHIFRKL